ncbi:MAG: hypothetical protein FJX75_11630 [Armatimonadetes bacterium]|nr:hypothetical protein [Armatimonadota bacterium]
MSAPLVVIAIDSAEITLIERWAADGHLPAFAALYRQAAYGRLDTTSDLLQGSVWPSFATGCHPGKHGSYYRLQMRSGKDEIARIRADHCFRLPFWAWFEGDDERAVVVDVPKMAPLANMNGLQVVEWGSADHYWEYATSPTQAAAVLLREYGEHPLLTEAPAPLTAGQRLRLKQRLLDGVAMKHRLNLGLLARHRPRVFVSVFAETHLAAHYFWRFMDANHPHHEPDPAMQTVLRDVYAAVDRFLGELIERDGGRSNLLIISGHGACADHSPYDALPALLYCMGMTVRPASGQAEGQRDALRRPGSLRRALKQAIPARLRRMLTRRMVPAAVREQTALRNAVRDIDFEASRAFCLPTDLQGYIRLNLEDREPTGTVREADYDEVCQEIEAEVLALEEAETGRKVVDRVVRTRDAYRGGDHLEQLPDVCVVWANDRPLSGIRSPRYGLLPAGRRLPERSGGHRPEGFFFATGPTFDPAQTGLRAHVLDLAPTVLRLLAKPIPEDFDGHPLPVLR